MLEILENHFLKIFKNLSHPPILAALPVFAVIHKIISSSPSRGHLLIYSPICPSLSSPLEMGRAMAVVMFIQDSNVYNVYNVYVWLSALLISLSYLPSWSGRECARAGEGGTTITNKSSDLHSAAVHSGKWAGETWQQLDYLPQYHRIWKHYTYDERPAAPRGEGRGRVGWR